MPPNNPQQHQAQADCDLQDPPSLTQMPPGRHDPFCLEGIASKLNPDFRSQPPLPLAPSPRQSSERAGQLEATLSSCRSRLGELRELRRQVRQLEERNAGHAERTRQLEEELRRAGSLRAQLEAQRLQVQQGLGCLGACTCIWALMAHSFHFGDPHVVLSPLEMRGLYCLCIWSRPLGRPAAL